MEKARLIQSLRNTAFAFGNLFPILIGMLLLTSLAVTVFPDRISAALFTGNAVLDALLGASLGGIAVGHPLASYLLAGELLRSGASLIGVTAFLVSWVTVGVVQLPAEVLMLGVRFALFRNFFCFCSAVAIALLSVHTLRLLD